MGKRLAKESSAKLRRQVEAPVLRVERVAVPLMRDGPAPRRRNLTGSAPPRFPFCSCLGRLADCVGREIPPRTAPPSCGANRTDGLKEAQWPHATSPGRTRRGVTAILPRGSCWPRSSWSPAETSSRIRTTGSPTSPRPSYRPRSRSLWRPEYSNWCAGAEGGLLVFLLPVTLLLEEPVRGARRPSEPLSASWSISRSWAACLWSCRGRADKTPIELDLEDSCR